MQFDLRSAAQVCPSFAEDRWRQTAGDTQAWTDELKKVLATSSNFVTDIERRRAARNGGDDDVSFRYELCNVCFLQEKDLNAHLACKHKVRKQKWVDRDNKLALSHAAVSNEVCPVCDRRFGSTRTCRAHWTQKHAPRGLQHRVSERRFVARTHLPITRSL